MARNYDHVIVDGGALAEAIPEFFARMAPCAVLVATDIDNAATRTAREQLIAAGFADVLLWLRHAWTGRVIAAGGCLEPLS